MEEDKPARPWLEHALLLGVLGLIGIQAFFPWLQVGFVTNDDLKLGNAVLARGFHGAVGMLWAFTRRDGRLDIAQLASWYLPFAVDSFLYFKAVCLAAIALDLVLFGLFVRSILGGSKAFYLAVLIALVSLQNSWEHTPIVAFPGLFTFTLAYLLASFLAFQHYLARRSALGAVASAFLFLVAICSYEMYLVYTPVFLGLALLAGRSPGRALRSIAFHLVAVVLQLSAWLTSHALRTGNYAGVTVGSGLDLERVLPVVWQFSVSSLPTYFFFSAKYDYLLDAARRTSGWPGLLAALTAGSVVKALLAGALLAYVMSRKEPEREPAGLGRTVALLVAGVGYFFAPCVLPALTERYQEEAKQQLGMQCSYFSLYAAVFLAVTVALVPGSRRVRPVLRGVFITVLAGLVMWASLVVDYTNTAVAEWQARGRERLQLIEQFLGSPGYAEMPDDSILYAPSLFKSIGTINYAGAALDPLPGLEWQYENYWTFYMNHRGGRRVAVTDRLERIPPEAKGFFYLRHARPGQGRGQYLVFAYVERGKSSPDLLLSDFVSIYDRSAWPSSVVGGVVAETDGVPVDVGLVKGGQARTADRFLFDVGTHYLELGPVLRSALEAPKNVIDVDSVFVAPSVAVELQVRKTQGWFQDSWIGAEAHAILPLRDRAHLVVDGYAPDYVFNKVGIKALTVSLEVDGVSVLTRDVSRGGRFRMETNVAPSSPGDLAIHCGPTHAPRLFGIPDDPRDLCMVVERVALRPLERGE